MVKLLPNLAPNSVTSSVLTHYGELISRYISYPECMELQMVQNLPQGTEAHEVGGNDTYPQEPPCDAHAQ